MQLTLFFTLLGLAATSIAVPSGFEAAGDVLHPLLPKADKRSVTAVDGLQSREIGGGFIAVIPKDSSFPAEGDDGSSKRRRRFLRQEEVVVPDSLQDPESKRAVYCKNSGYGLCPSLRYCCPLVGNYCISHQACSIVDCAAPAEDAAKVANGAAASTDAVPLRTTVSS
ncbi:hypothetical protein M407DRAFT_24667 [Tulasnella calospora MUT 4182]|uniref:Uncharacterized protein n=1 Tax=Tulasnella calospora MUT 4182 TaxID=1051891 RepID=A0A0C3KX34_9AGAM|nr:hypothetical protein M407DRAFT_24667 [Tulasnella calospora MUT 4182]